MDLTKNEFFDRYHLSNHQLNQLEKAFIQVLYKTFKSEKVHIDLPKSKIVKKKVKESLQNWRMQILTEIWAKYQKKKITIENLEQTVDEQYHKVVFRTAILTLVENESLRSQFVKSKGDFFHFNARSV
jgi:hypothetical protein